MDFIGTHLTVCTSPDEPPAGAADLDELDDLSLLQVQLATCEGHVVRQHLRGGYFKIRSIDDDILMHLCTIKLYLNFINASHYWLT